MPKIQIYERSQSIPRTTGVPALNVQPVQDKTGQALMQMGDTFSKIGADLQLAQDKRDVSSSTLSATLKLNDLTTEMSRMDGSIAVSTYEQRAGAVFAEITEGMNARTLDAFTANWNDLNAKAMAAIKGAGLKRWHQQQEGGMEQTLDIYARAAGARAAGPVDHALILKNGFADIDDMVKHHVIAPDVGARRKIKFQRQVAESAVTGWVNRQTQDSMMGAQRQMDTEKFDDPSIGQMWKQLDEKTKASMNSRAITNIKNALSFADKEEARRNNNLKVAAKKLMFEFVQEKTKPERRQQILNELSRNKTVEIGTYDTLLKHFQGKTSRFDDTGASNKLKSRILKTPHLVTDDEIIKSNLSNVGELLQMLNTEMDARTSRAREIVRNSPAFIPSNPVDARLKGEAFDAAQADIWTTVLREMTDAGDKGETFDPVARVNDLIKEFKKEQDANPETAANAKTALDALGIKTPEDVDTYFAEHGSNAGERNKINKWAREAWGK